MTWLMLLLLHKLDNQVLAQLPQLLLQCSTFGQLAGLAEEAIVEVQSRQSGQLIGRRTVDTCGSRLLLPYGAQKAISES